ncbi:MAG: hypothetical protein ACE5J6_04495 [Candidatus Bathyarchaeia archaeon]
MDAGKNVREDYADDLENSTHVFLHFTYNHTIHNVRIYGTEVIPEFPTWASMLLMLRVLTVAIAIYKRRLLKTPFH